jgi:hypothetical protein
MQFKELGGDLFQQALVPSQATAGTDYNWPVWSPSAKAVVTAVKFVPRAAVTADPTNNTIYTLTNKVSGAGSAAIATRTWAAGNSVASTPESFTLSGTAANLLVGVGDNIEVVKTHGGTGLVIPDGLIVITYRLTGV